MKYGISLLETDVSRNCILNHDIIYKDLITPTMELRIDQFSKCGKATIADSRLIGQSHDGMNLTYQMEIIRRFRGEIATEHLSKMQLRMGI